MSQQFWIDYLSPATTCNLLFFSLLMHGRNICTNSSLYFSLKTPYTTGLTLEFKQVIKVKPVTEKLLARIQKIDSVIWHIINRVTTTMTIKAILSSVFWDAAVSPAKDCMLVFANCLFVCLTWNMILMPCPFTGPKMFWAGPNFLCQTKHLFTYCGSHKHFEPDKNMICIQ